MKKSVKIAGVVLGVGLVFSTGAFVGANSDWKTKAINDSYSSMLTVASDKTTELTANTQQDIENKIQSEISGTLDANEAELQRLLDEYYQLKLNNMTSSSEFQDLETQIAQIRQNVYESYRAQIDQAFEGQ